MQDTKRIYDYAIARPDVDASKIVVLGRKLLGSYFSVALAKARRLRGAILATPFDSFAALGGERYPWLPVGLILNGRYDAAAMAPMINIPALFVLGESTTTLRRPQTARRWRAPGVGRSAWSRSPGARHYGIERRDEFWNAVEDFLLRDRREPAAAERLRGRRRFEPAQLACKRLA